MFSHNGSDAGGLHPRRVRPQLVPALPESEDQDELLQALVLPQSSRLLSTDSAGDASNNRTAGSRESNRTRSTSDQVTGKREDTK